MFYLNQTKSVNLTPTAQELKEIKEQIILYHKETVRQIHNVGDFAKHLTWTLQKVKSWGKKVGRPILD